MKFNEQNSLRNLENSDLGTVSVVKSLNVELCLEDSQCDPNSDLFGVQNTEKTYKINYVKGELEEDTNDEPEEKKGVQTYIIAIIIVITFLVILGGGFLIYKYVFAKKDNNNRAEEIANEDESIRKKTVSQFNSSTKRSISNKKKMDNVIPFKSQFYS